MNSVNNFSHNYYCELIIIKDHNTKGLSEGVICKLKPKK